MNNYYLNASNVKKEITSGNLKMNGSSPDGTTIDFNSFSMLKNGKPFYSISGEFHFSRYNYKNWEEEILKCKACGLDTIATYMFWIHHEFNEGEFKFGGNNNIRLFLEFCKKHNVTVILRIGPYSHGECRNGGLPDWMFGRPFEVRSNDEGYLKYVQRYFSKIGEQVAGLMFKDGGPVIAIQLENEYMAATSPWEATTSHKLEWITHGNAGVAHVEKLRELAQSFGLITPFITFTAWGDSPYVDNEMLPLWGCYAYWPWLYWTDDHVEHPQTGSYVFEDYHDVKRNEMFSKYPFACGEMGGGMQVFYPYRFIVEPESVEAMTLNNIAGGCNILGYFMFHGGRNPVINGTSTNEKLCPKISYDFQAPLGDFGIPKNSFKRIKLIHFMLRDFNDFFCSSATAIQQEEVIPSEDKYLRYAARVDNNSGFLFINNYQDHMNLSAKSNQSVTVKTADKEITIPHSGGMFIERNASMALPFGFNLNGLDLEYATTQYISKIEDNGKTCYFFFNHFGLNGELCFMGDVAVSNEIGITKTIIDNRTILKTNCSLMCSFDTENATFVIMTREQSFDFWKVPVNGKDYAIITSANVTSSKNNISFENIGAEDFEVLTFPEIADKNLTIIPQGSISLLSKYKVLSPTPEIAFSYDTPYENRALLHIDTTNFASLSQVFLHIDYIADKGWAFIDGQLVHDDLCKGNTWIIGLKDFEEQLQKNEMYLYLSPLSDDRKVNIESTSTYAKVGLDDDAQAKFLSIKLVKENTVTIEI